MNRLLLVLFVSGLAVAQIQEVSGERIRAHAKFLSSDLLEGRGVGERGGRLASEYIAAQFALLGAEPAGDNGTYFQRVPLVGIATDAAARFSASGNGESLTFEWLEDIVGNSLRQKPMDEFDAEAVFVGHGIVAPEFQWDDFKGVDVRGKVLILFTNEPKSEDPAVFGGRALTYYGRWTFKYEEALRRGAVGALIIHTEPTAGYGWSVVRNSWGREQPFVKLEEGEPALSFAGWVSEEAGRRLLRVAGKSLDELLAAAESPDFQPIPLGIRFRGHVPSEIRQIETRNVAAIVPGGDSERASETVIYSAHWDHLGVGTPVDGDSIYNGAVDNATGSAMMLEVARAWAALDQKPRRSALFLSVTAEEGGLRGSGYYAKHPLVPTGKTALALNLDAYYPYGRTKDIVVQGAERTTFWEETQDAASRMNLVITPDPEPEQGNYYRSDHFSFAQAGIPAFSIHMGSELTGKPSAYGARLSHEFNERHYHQPSDEYSEDWDFSGLEQVARFALLLGIDAANLPSLPTWKAGDEFLAERISSGVK